MLYFPCMGKVGVKLIQPGFLLKFNFENAYFFKSMNVC